MSSIEINPNCHRTRSGTRSSCLRAILHHFFFDTGCFVQRNAGKVLFVAIIALGTLCVALKSAIIQTEINKLWVEEDGRLENELNFMEKTLGEGLSDTNQIIIQTPKSSDNILNPDALLQHLEALKAATEVTVDMFEVTWRMKDLCYAYSVPLFEEAHIDKILEELFPCAIVTPLDCFWEGSKLLGPEFPITVPGLPSINLKWTHLNPQRMIDMMREMDANNHVKSSQFTYMAILEIMNRAGITTAYQEKPCLNASDPACPSSAPNKESQKVPDIGKELTGGCYGFATKFMHWPEDMIVSGVTKNRSGRILKAKALQSSVQLMADSEMFEYWKDHYKVHNIDWSLDKARQIMEAWLRKFSDEVYRFNREQSTGQVPPVRSFNFHVFTSISLVDIMRNFSTINVYKIVITLASIVSYVFIVFSKWDDNVTSMRFVGLAGVTLVSFSVASGLGLCALLRLPFSAATTQIIPFICVGFGMYHLFLMTSAYSEVLKSHRDSSHQELVGMLLMKVGPLVLLTSTATASGFLSAYIIPLPALRAFVLQAAIIVAVTALTLIILFPAIVGLDLKRRRSEHVDLFCCFTAEEECDHLRNDVKLNNLTNDAKNSVRAASSTGWTKQTNLSSETLKRIDVKVYEPFLGPKSNEKVLNCSVGDAEQGPHNRKYKLSEKVSLNFFAKTYLGPLITKKPFKAFVLLSCIIFLCFALSGIPKVQNGLSLTDIVPKDTLEHSFLELQSEHFNHFNMFAVTKGNFEYPTNQKLLIEYHHAFTRVDKIIKNDDGGLPDFWLIMFRDWLINLQHIFDQEFASGLITQEGWTNNASDDGILAYKLLVQTGRVDNPVDKSLVTKVKLVDEQSGIINAKAFYNYLTAWVSNDAIAYSASQANFRPVPKEWTHVARDYELKIPKSQPLKYTQMPFYMNKMKTTEEITAAIEEVRSICQKYEDRGLPNFPTGVPFIFWEQYVRLSIYLLSGLVIVLAAIFLVICIFLFNPQTGLLMVILLVMLVGQLYGLMGHFGITMNAVPTVILIFALGIQANIFLPITVSFLTSVGPRNRRASAAIESMFSPLVHGILSTLFGIGMLAFSEFTFITRYFAFLLCGLTALGSLYGLVLLPVLLSIFGPPTEIVPLGNCHGGPAPASGHGNSKCRPGGSHGHRHGPSWDKKTPATPPLSHEQLAAVAAAYASGQHGSSRTTVRSSSSSASSGRGCHSSQSYRSSGQRVSSSCSNGSGRARSHSDSDDYLSTIYEEGSSCRSSHEFIVQPELVVKAGSATPELVVKTTTILNVQLGSLSDSTKLYQTTI
ncbi:Protein patched [Halotydeus destructor]|nr:Protein patched [Halotydeus destructor]